MDFDPVKHTRITLTWLRKQTDSVILFYSGSGKDSLVLLDLLSKYEFKRIVCCFMYIVKDLEHLQPYFDWIKRYPNTELIQYPHWILSQYKKNNWYQFHKESNKNVKRLTLQDIYEKAKKDTGIDYIVNGAKRSDSFNRMIWLGNMKFNAISKKNIVYPLSYWKKKDVVRYLEFHNIIKPVDYNSANKRSAGFDIRLDNLLYLRKKHPNDLQKVLKEYPFAGVLLIEYDYGQQNLEVSEVSDRNDSPLTD